MDLVTLCGGSSSSTTVSNTVLTPTQLHTVIIASVTIFACLALVGFFSVVYLRRLRIKALTKAADKSGGGDPNLDVKPFGGNGPATGTTSAGKQPNRGGGTAIAVEGTGNGGPATGPGTGGGANNLLQSGRPYTEPAKGLHSVVPAADRVSVVETLDQHAAPSPHRLDRDGRVRVGGPAAVGRYSSARFSSPQAGGGGSGVAGRRGGDGRFGAADSRSRVLEDAGVAHRPWRQRVIMPTYDSDSDGHGKGQAQLRSAQLGDRWHSNNNNDDDDNTTYRDGDRDSDHGRREMSPRRNSSRSRSRDNVGGGRARSGSPRRANSSGGDGRRLADRLVNPFGDSDDEWDDVAQRDGDGSVSGLQAVPLLPPPTSPDNTDAEIAAVAARSTGKRGRKVVKAGGGASRSRPSVERRGAAGRRSTSQRRVSARDDTAADSDEPERVASPTRTGAGKKKSAVRQRSGSRSRRSTSAARKTKSSGKNRAPAAPSASESDSESGSTATDKPTTLQSTTPSPAPTATAVNATAAAESLAAQQLQLQQQQLHMETQHMQLQLQQQQLLEYHQQLLDYSKLASAAAAVAASNATAGDGGAVGLYAPASALPAAVSSVGAPPYGPVSYDTVAGGYPSQVYVDAGSDYLAGAALSDGAHYPVGYSVSGQGSYAPSREVQWGPASSPRSGVAAQGQRVQPQTWHTADRGSVAYTGDVPVSFVDGYVRGGGY